MILVHSSRVHNILKPSPPHFEQDSVPQSATPSRAGRYYRDTVLYQTVSPKHRRTVSVLFLTNEILG